MSKKKKKSLDLAIIPMHLCLIIFGAVIITPLLYVLAISFSRDQDIVEYGYSIIPHVFSTLAYQQAFANPIIITRAYGVSIVVTLVGTIMSLFLTMTVAYVATRKDYAYRKFTSYYLIIPLLFNGGMVASYIINSQVLHLNDKIWALILPYGVNVWYAFMMKGFMGNLPFELIESAKIDGASEYSIFYRVIMPLSKSSMATIGLFYAFAFWNDWWLAMLYITKTKLVPLQYLLQRIMSNIEFYTSQLPSGLSVAGGNIPLEATRMALAVIAVGPMIVIFPFFQKYFVKGVTIGSVKG